MKISKLLYCAPFLGAMACGDAGEPTLGEVPTGPALDEGVLAKRPGGAPAPADGPLYGRALTESDISKTFGLAPNQQVTRSVFEEFLKSKMNVPAADASQAATAFLVVGSAAFIADPQKQQDLAAEGLSASDVQDGLSPKEYLAYLRIAHGDGKCARAKAGSAECPAYVRDFQMSLITNQNPIFNIRVPGPDRQYDNTLTIHRESQANRQLFEYVGASLGLGGNPLKSIEFDPSNPSHCTELEGMLGSSGALEKFLSQTVKVNPVVAAVASRQWANTVSEITNGVTYLYGFSPFLRGKVCSRDNVGQCYAADPNMVARLEQLVPGALTKTSFDCREIAKLVNVLTSVPRTGAIDFSNASSVPYDVLSPKLTADELFDMFIALGNALTNRPNAPFADTLPRSDLGLLDNSGVYNPENQMTSQVHRYFMQRFVGR
jgi:hypothetical protein